MSPPGRGLRARSARVLGGAPRTSGFPTSSNRASSFHLHWLGLPSERLVEASVELEVVAGPAVPHLYFWALQASFADGRRRLGGAHLGLQWHAAAPRPHRGELGRVRRRRAASSTGSESPLPSATGNPNTRDFCVVPRVGPTASRSAPADSPVPGVVRSTASACVSWPPVVGELVDLMVWSEVFARCDDPSVVVRWRNFAAVTPDGREVRPDRLQVTYQSAADGGCDNTSVAVEGGAAEQVTAVSRQVPSGTVLPL